MVRVLVTEPIHPDALEELRRHFEVHFIPIEEVEKRGGLAKLVKELKPNVLIVRSKTKVTKEVLDHVEFVGRPGVGLDNVDLEYAKRRGVEVRNTPDAEAISTSVAELVFALLLAVMRKVTVADSAMKRGFWVKRNLPVSEMHTLSGKVMAVVGLGRIGKKVALLAKAFGMRVIYYSVPREYEFEERYGVEFYDLTEEDRREGLKVPGKLLEQADVITFHVPLIPETRHMLSGKELERIKEGAIIINTSRGPVVDEEALYQALISGKLLGAGLDVYSQEPPKERWLQALISLPNVVTTPHLGSSTEEAQRDAAMRLVALIKERYL